MMTEFPAKRSGWPRGVLWVMGLLPPFFWAASFWCSQAHEDTFLFLANEDGVIETGQALLYLVAVGLSAALTWTLRQRGEWRWAIAYGLVTLGLGWVASEEISWGQRLFHVETPAWFAARNTQGEMNLHNLPSVANALKNVNSYGSLAAIVLSLVSLRMNGRALANWRAHLWIPHPALIPAWLCVLSYSGLRLLYRWSHPEARGVSRVVSRLQEPAELILVLALMTFLVMALVQVQWNNRQQRIQRA